VRISELSRVSGVSIATIKYYLRAGVLGPGRHTARNQAQYGDAHAHRLRLIRVLMDVGGLSLAAVSDVLDAIDDNRLPLHRLMGVAHHALGPHATAAPAPDVTEAQSDVGELIERLGWKVSARAPARGALAEALVALRRLGYGGGVEVLAPYAELAGELAGRELTTVAPGAARHEVVEHVVVGTVVFEAAFVALRRLAQEHHSAARFAGG